ncbi:TPA: lipopolysaccharide biosynthesis protein [Proteus mirabilis]
MRQQKSLKNIKIDFIITLLIVFITFFSRKIIIDSMGADLTGLILLFNQLLSMLNIAELGIGTATASLLYKPLKEKNNYELKQILSSAKYIYNIIFFVVIILGVTGGIIVYLNIEGVSNIPKSYFYWLLLVLSTSISYKYSYIIIFFTANQEYYLVRKIQGGYKIITLLLQIMAIYFLQSYLFYILIELCINLLQLIHFKMLKKEKHPHLKIANTKGLYYQYIKMKIKNSFFHKIASIIVFNSDYIVISKLLSLSIVTIYSSYMMINQAINLFINVLGNSITPSVGDFLVSKNKDDIFDLLKEIFFIFYFLALVISIVTYYMIDSFINIWIGNSYIIEQNLLIVFIANLFISISRISIDVFKNAKGIFEDIFNPILEAVINLIFSIILTIYYGLIGILIGTLISNILIICLSKPIYTIKKILGNNYIMKFYIFIFKLTALSILPIIFIINIITKENSPMVIEWIVNFLYCLFITLSFTIIFLSIEPTTRKVIHRFLRITLKY